MTLKYEISNKGAAQEMLDVLLKYYPELGNFDRVAIAKASVSVADLLGNILAPLAKAEPEAFEIGLDILFQRTRHTTETFIKLVDTMKSASTETKQ